MPFARPHLRWKTGNDVSLLENGIQLFPALCEAFDLAKTSIHIEMYIFRMDSAGQQILHHLGLAARRGVKVRVVIDGFGSAADDEILISTLRATGAQCRVYRPEPKHLTIRSFDFMRLRRLHRKIVVVDGVLGFVGGINIEDDYSANNSEIRTSDPRFDYAVRVTGPIVEDLIQAIETLWLRTRKYTHLYAVDIGKNTDVEDEVQNIKNSRWHRLYIKHLRMRLRRFKNSKDRSATDSTLQQATPGPSQPNMRAALLLRDNLRYRRTIESAYLSYIAGAQTEIIIANAYFLPGGKLRRALIDAAHRGVSVRLLLQGKIEYQMQYHATRWIYDLFLKEGIHIYEYLPSFLHAKVAVIDDVSIVGSSNLDPFSLLLAREANVLVEDASFTASLRQSLENAMTRGSKIIELSLYHSRPWLGRLADGLCYLLLRIGVTLSGKGDQY